MRSGLPATLSLSHRAGRSRSAQPWGMEWWRTSPTVFPLILWIFIRENCTRNPGPLSRKRTFAQCFARLVDVLRDLPRERRRARETQLVAQALDEFDADAVAIQVDVPIEQEHFEPPRATAEGRAHAQAGRAHDAIRSDVGPHRIDAVAREQALGRYLQIDRRESERAASFVAVLDRAGHRVGSTERARRGRDVAREQRVADARGADEMPVDDHGRRGIDGEAVLRAEVLQHLDVP